MYNLPSVVTTVPDSVRKSGPVQSLAPQGLGPRPRPVHIYFRLEKRPDWTAKDRRKPVFCGLKTGLGLLQS
jgi:hypothetical protein